MNVQTNENSKSMRPRVLGTHLINASIVHILSAISYSPQAFALVVRKGIESIPRLLLLLCPITQLEHPK